MTAADVTRWHSWSVRTSYLRRPVHDLDDLTSRPRHYGIDIVDDAAEARDHVRAIPANEQLWAEGFIELSIDGTELLTPRLWDYVHVLWHTLVQLAVDVIEHGTAEQSFPGQDLMLSLRTLQGGRMVRFEVGDASVTCDREDFLAQLAEHATSFYDWLDAATGEVSEVEREQLAQIRAALAR